MSKFKPGQVVHLSPEDTLTDGTLRTAIGVVTNEPVGSRGWLRWFYADGRYARDHGCKLSPTSVRPLVVIDPEDREAVERLASLLWPHYDSNRLAHLRKAEVTADALREFANPTPPKPDEPTGLGAVVEDEDGSLLIRNGVTGDRPWVTIYGTSFGWREIDAVRVLSEGVQP